MSMKLIKAPEKEAQQTVFWFQKM